MTYYISITGLRVKSIWHFPQFAYHASQSMKQAQQANGNVSARGNYKHGVHHTLSIWKDRKSMARYMASGAHAQAMKMANALSATNGIQVYGYESDTIPSWEQALDLWKERGMRHGKVILRTTTLTTTDVLVKEQEEKPVKHARLSWPVVTAYSGVAVLGLALYLRHSMETFELDTMIGLGQ
jgi:hypothetical protein